MATKDKEIHSMKSMIYRVNMGDWIRCGERLPEHSGKYLVCVGYLDETGETYAVMEADFVHESESSSDMSEWFFKKDGVAKHVAAIVAWLEEDHINDDDI